MVICLFLYFKLLVYVCMLWGSFLQTQTNKQTNKNTLFEIGDEILV